MLMPSQVTNDAILYSNSMKFNLFLLLTVGQSNTQPDLFLIDGAIKR